MFMCFSSLCIRLHSTLCTQTLECNQCMRSTNSTYTESHGHQPPLQWKWIFHANWCHISTIELMLHFWCSCAMCAPHTDITFKQLRDMQWLWCGYTRCTRARQRALVCELCLSLLGSFSISFFFVFFVYDRTLCSSAVKCARGYIRLFL